MDRWKGKVAVVSGASSGIGAAIAKDLVKAGMQVVGLARRKERVEAMAAELGEPNGGKLIALKCDVSKEQEIVRAFEWINRTLGGVAVMVNNAGLLRNTMLTAPDNSQILREVLDINVLGLCFCTREAVQSMRDRNVAGHIIHINSIVGHHVPVVPGKRPRFNMYIGSKHAVTGLTETLRQELNYLETSIKVTSISPGIVETEIFDSMLGSPEMAKRFLDSQRHLQPEDVAQACVYVLGTPPHVQVHELTIKTVGELY